MDVSIKVSGGTLSKKPQCFKSFSMTSCRSVPKYLSPSNFNTAMGEGFSSLRKNLRLNQRGLQGSRRGTIIFFILHNSFRAEDKFGPFPFHMFILCQSKRCTLWCHKSLLHTVGCCLKGGSICPKFGRLNGNVFHFSVCPNIHNSFNDNFMVSHTFCCTYQHSWICWRKVSSSEMLVYQKYYLNQKL